VSGAERYRTALLDWLACAAGGAPVPAAVAARAAGDGLLERIAAVGVAGHVLDYDDTYLPGLAHLSAAVAPASLVLAADLGRDVGEALDAYAAGFEATGALARAGHPALYERGWHPTAVCGTVGAAVAAARLLELEREQSDAARALALLRASGLRAAFGSDGKAIQVGMAAAAGVHAARLAGAGARAPLETITSARAGFEQAFGAPWAEPSGEAAVNENWIKAYPCCLATHSAIEAAAELRSRDGWSKHEVVAVVHPRSRQAAWLDDVEDTLQAKFSIPYLTAYTLLHGPPGLRSFDTVDAEARSLGARGVSVRLDDSLLESEARLERDGEVLARVEHALGSPQRPLDEARLAAKVDELVGDRLDGVLSDRARPATDVLAAAGLD
jgi:2-methylcitrate dehydratase PrpD